MNCWKRRFFRAIFSLSNLSITEIYILFLNVLQLLAINMPFEMQMSSESVITDW
jgi:hypothetical protein